MDNYFGTRKNGNNGQQNWDRGSNRYCIKHVKKIYKTLLCSRYVERCRWTTSPCFYTVQSFNLRLHPSDNHGPACQFQTSFETVDYSVFHLTLIKTIRSWIEMGKQCYLFKFSSLPIFLIHFLNDIYLSYCSP